MIYDKRTKKKTKTNYFLDSN